MVGRSVAVASAVFRFGQSGDRRKKSKKLQAAAREEKRDVYYDVSLGILNNLLSRSIGGSTTLRHRTHGPTMAYSDSTRPMPVAALGGIFNSFGGV